MKSLLVFLLALSVARATTPKVEEAVFATIDLERVAASGLKLEEPSNLPDFKLTYLRGPGPTDVIGIYKGGFPTLFNTHGEQLAEIKGTIAGQAITWICWSEQKDGKKLFGSETVVSSSRMVVEVPEAKTESVVLFHIFILRQDAKALSEARDFAAKLIKKGPNQAPAPDPTPELVVSSVAIPEFEYIHDTTKFVSEDTKELTAEARRALGVVKKALAQRLGKEIEGRYWVAVATWGYQVNFTGLKSKKDGIWTDLPEGFGEAFLSKNLAQIKIDYGP